MNEKVQTMADLLHIDPTRINGGGLNIFGYKDKIYWVVTDSEKGIGAGPSWRWIGQLGNIHVYERKIKINTI